MAGTAYSYKFWICLEKRWARTYAHILYIFVYQSVQLLSHVWLFAAPWTAASQASLSITNSQSLLKLMSIESVMPSNHLILCRPLLFLPSIFPSIKVFSDELVLCIRWPKHWSFSLSISPSNEQPGLIFFGMDWLDLLTVQETLKSLLQHHSSKASIPWHSAFFTVQLSHSYMTTGKTIALTRPSFFGKYLFINLFIYNISKSISKHQATGVPKSVPKSYSLNFYHQKWQTNQKQIWGSKQANTEFFFLLHFP